LGDVRTQSEEKGEEDAGEGLPMPPEQLELILAKERAEAAEQAKSSFLAGIVIFLRGVARLAPACG
jgi:hypothetical protein